MSGIPSIYVDAFQNDYTEDAFISIASAITSYVDKHSIAEPRSKEFKEKAKKVGVRLLAWSVKIGVKAATLGVVKESDVDALVDVGKDVAADTSNAISNLVSERLNAHSAEFEAIQAFRDSLSEIPSALVDNKSDRLVIIIDGLDRCRPSFAVEVLEKIKHLFSVQKVVFVLVMHKEQLEEAIRCVYGDKIDAHTYLQKFINIETVIPKKTADRYGNDVGVYINKLFYLHEFQDSRDARSLLDCLKVIALFFNLSLRQIEKIFTNLAVFYSTSESNGIRFSAIIAFLSAMKVVSPNIFTRLSSGAISFTKLHEEIEALCPDKKLILN